ncbi:MAG: hypothetical protein CMM50_00120 [Rhodospirillaceae bacterium]|nr:hypothetical protein [Rhodospirillaceae bacterium]
MTEGIGINGLDLVVFGLLLIAALLGLAVGFVRGVLYVLCWIGAAVATIYGFPHVRPLAREYIGNEIVADVVGAAGLFILSMAVLFLLSAVFGGWVRGSRLNALDRSLGFVAAAGAAAFLLCAIYIPFRAFVPVEEQPGWVRQARVIPLIELGSDFVQTELLNRVDDTLIPATRPAEGGALDTGQTTAATVRRLSEPQVEVQEPADEDSDTVYGDRDRQQLNRLLESVQQDRRQ